MIRRPPRSTLFPYNDALPIYRGGIPGFDVAGGSDVFRGVSAQAAGRIYGGFGSIGERSEEHTSELQSPCKLVCRLLLEKKKTKTVSRPRSLKALCRTTRLARP